MTVPEIAYRAETELLAIAKQPERLPWQLMTEAEKNMYAVMLADRFAFPERET